MPNSTKNMLTKLSGTTDKKTSGDKQVADAVDNPTPTPSLSMSDVLANCLAPRKNDPNLIPH